MQLYHNTITVSNKRDGGSFHLYASVPLRPQECARPNDGAVSNRMHEQAATIDKDKREEVQDGREEEEMQGGDADDLSEDEGDMDAEGSTEEEEEDEDDEASDDEDEYEEEDIVKSRVSDKAIGVQVKRERCNSSKSKRARVFHACEPCREYQMCMWRRKCLCLHFRCFACNAGKRKAKCSMLTSKDPKCERCKRFGLQCVFKNPPTLGRRKRGLKAAIAKKARQARGHVRADVLSTSSKTSSCNASANSKQRVGRKRSSSSNDTQDVFAISRKVERRESIQVRRSNSAGGIVGPTAGLNNFPKKADPGEAPTARSPTETASEVFRNRSADLYIRAPSPFAGEDSVPSSPALTTPADLPSEFPGAQVVSSDKRVTAPFEFHSYRKYEESLGNTLYEFETLSQLHRSMGWGRRTFAQDASDGDLFGPIIGGDMSPLLHGGLSCDDWDQPTQSFDHLSQRILMEQSKYDLCAPSVGIGSLFGYQ